MKDAAWWRAYRAARGARTGKSGPPPTEPCGTRAAHERHRRHGEPIDDACRQAYNAYQRERYRNRSKG